MKKIFLLIFLSTIVWSIKAQVKIPQNTLDKKRIPSWIIAKTSKINEGTIVMHITNIGPNASVGRNCIINTGSIIEHDVKIGDHCHIATGCKINGNVSISNNCFIGSGSIIKEGVKIQSGKIIPMGSVIKKNV